MILLLDIDGVVIPEGNIRLKGDNYAPPEPCRRLSCHAYRTDFDAYIPERIVEHLFTLDKYFDINWFTRWPQEAAEQLLFDFEYRNCTFKGSTPKWRFTPDEDYVWIDDTAWEAGQEHPEGSLWIQPHPEVGIDHNITRKALEHIGV